MTRPDESLAPNRRSRRATPAAAGPPTDYDEAEVARGTAAAVLGALGRMQLKLEVLAREQSEALARVEARLEALQQQLDELTVVEEPYGE
jgi:hypothetical protein